MIKKFIKQLFCKHNYVLISDETYDIIDTCNRTVGNIKLKLFICKKCDKPKVEFSDKRWEKYVKLNLYENSN